MRRLSWRELLRHSGHGVACASTGAERSRGKILTWFSYFFLCSKTTLKTDSTGQPKSDKTFLQMQKHQKCKQISDNMQTKSEKKSDKTEKLRQIRKIIQIRQKFRQNQKTKSEHFRQIQKKSDNFRQAVRELRDNRTTDKISSMNLSIFYICALLV